MKTYHKTSEGSNSNCKKFSQVGISNKGTNERNNIGDSHPSIHNICSKNLIHVIHFHQINNKVCLHSISCQSLNCVISCTLLHICICLLDGKNINDIFDMMGCGFGPIIHYLYALNVCQFYR